MLRIRQKYTEYRCIRIDVDMHTAEGIVLLFVKRGSGVVGALRGLYVA